MRYVDFGRIADQIVVDVQTTLWSGVDSAKIIAHLDAAFDRGKEAGVASVVSPKPYTIEPVEA